MAGSCMVQSRRAKVVLEKFVVCVLCRISANGSGRFVDPNLAKSSCRDLIGRAKNGGMSTRDTRRLIISSDDDSTLNVFRKPAHLQKTREDRKHDA